MTLFAMGFLWNGARGKSKVRRFGVGEILPKGEKGCEQ
jgi:hypothetical protein